MVGAILHQLTRCMSADEIKKAGFDTYFVNRGNGVFPEHDGHPWNADTIASTGDVISDLHENMAADAATV